MGRDATACRVKRLDGELAITYTYPRVAGRLPRGLDRKWARFLAGVRKHEEMHGDWRARWQRRRKDRSPGSPSPTIPAAARPASPPSGG